MTLVPTFAVFVPTAIGAGLVTSLVLVLTDAAGELRSTRQRERTAGILGESTAALVRSGSARDASRVGVRSRRAATVLGLAAGSLGVYGLIGSFWNYWNPDERFRDLAWLWTTSWLVAGAFLAIGIAALRIGRTDRPLRGLSRRLVVGSRLGALPVERATVAVPTSEGRAEEVLGQQQDGGAEEHAGDDV